MASEFSFNLNDLSDGKSITSKIKSSFYPENQQIIKNTSASVEGEVGRKLMSRDPVRILQGDGIYRNPAFALAGYEQNVKSSMHTIISMGADFDDTVSVPDPDDPNKSLKGSQARMEIARKNVMSTGFAPGGFDRAMKAFVSSSSGFSTSGAAPTGTGTGATSGTETVTTATGAAQPHSTATYSSARGAQVLNNSNRQIAFLDEMSEDEKKVYDRKVSELLKKANFKTEGDGDIQVFKSGFKLSFNKSRTVNGAAPENVVPQDLTSLGFSIYQSGYYTRGSNNTYKWNKDKITQIGQGEKQILMSPTLIEFLLRITDNLYIMGDTGVWRGIAGPNFKNITAEKNSISDHAFGRGFDIKSIGKTNGQDVVNLNKPVPAPGKYLSTLDLFLSYVEQLPQELHPDLIVISDQLETELGIIPGLEANDSAIRVKHPNLAPFTNFFADQSHRNHIHVSWSSYRCGSFILPSVTTSASSTETTTSSTTTATATAPTGTLSTDLLTKLKKQYYTGDEALSPTEIFDMLYRYGGFSAEIAAIFTGIAQRESNFTPHVCNRQRGFWVLAIRYKNIRWRTIPSNTGFSNEGKS